MTTAIINVGMEVGPCHHGLCVQITKNKQREELGVGHRRSSDEGRTFLGCEDDRSIDYFEKIIHRGDHETTWSTIIDRLRSGPEVCVRVLAELATGIGDSAEV